MRLKIFVSAMILASCVLLLGWPIWVGPLPHRPATKAQIRRYSQRAICVVGGLLVTLVASGVGAVLLIKQAKREYESGTMMNVKDLVEGTMEDHKKKALGSDES